MNTASEYYKKGFSAFKMRDYKSAISYYQKALELNPNYIEVLINLGALYQQNNSPKMAIKYYERALEHHTDHTVLHFNLAVLYDEQERYKQAQKYFQKVLENTPFDAQARTRYALCLKKMHKYKQAYKQLKKSYQYSSNQPGIHFHMGVVKSIIAGILNSTEETRVAIDHFKRASLANPKSVESLSNIGSLQQRLGDDSQAIKSYERALEINPNQLQTMNNLASIYEKKGDYSKAAEYYKQTLDQDPNFAESLGAYCFVTRQICDWEEYEKHIKTLDKLSKRQIEKHNKPPETAFFNAIRVQDQKHNSQVAKRWTDFKINRYKTLNPKIYTHSKKKNKDKIKIAYASDGFREFPTAHNITGVLENHDKSKFETCAYSYGRDDKSIYRERIKNAVNNFVDLQSMNLIDSAERIYKDDIDILVDLKGHTKGGRFEIFYHRPAKIQVEWLGFVGSTQADFIDYYIADKNVLPKQAAKYFSEKIIYMPDTYWPTNDKLKISENNKQRSDFGLPEKKIVFASFNQPYKIEPEIFNLWMKILKKTPGSVLWQWTKGDAFEKNLLNYAQKAGVENTRIIFAKNLAKEDHLARIKLADIALDTFTCNGHTTTTDCLWAGIPVVSLTGKHFASRVSKSILEANGLPELVVSSKQEYKNLALKLASNKTMLTKLKNKIIKNNKTKPLFDTKKFTKNLEKKYIQILSDYYG